MNFDEPVDRHGTHSLKWDCMEPNFGVSAKDGIPMWVADMDFKSADCIQRAVKQQLDIGVYGYFGDFSEYNASICWWMKNRHGWDIDPGWIFTTHGLCNAVGLVLQAFTEPGDGVLLMTPVYHAFARVINAAGRRVVECPMAIQDNAYRLDIDTLQGALTGGEKMMILCSPHNPGGKIWSGDDLREIAAFCTRNDLLLVSDEIHHDLVYPGHTHIPTHVAAPESQSRLVTLSAPSKTFNIAGAHNGNVIIPDERLRKRFAATMSAFSVSPNNFGVVMTTAAYSAEGAAWLEELIAYLDTNRRVFREGVDAIPGVRMMEMDATYLAWVDFRGTGMQHDEILRRVMKDARIVPSDGPTFGTGGDGFLRFNLGTQKARIEEAVSRLNAAFSDLQ